MIRTPSAIRPMPTVSAWRLTVRWASPAPWNSSRNRLKRLSATPKVITAIDVRTQARMVRSLARCSVTCCAFGWSTDTSRGGNRKEDSRQDCAALCPRQMAWRPGGLGDQQWPIVLRTVLAEERRYEEMLHVPIYRLIPAALALLMFVAQAAAQETRVAAAADADVIALYSQYIEKRLLRAR